MLHDSQDDVSEARDPSPGQREAIDLLALDPGHQLHVRLSLADWRRVNRLCDVLADARNPAVPSPRPASDFPSGASR